MESSAETAALPPGTAPASAAPTSARPRPHTSHAAHHPVSPFDIPRPHIERPHTSYGGRREFAWTRGELASHDVTASTRAFAASSFANRVHLGLQDNKRQFFALTFGGDGSGAPPSPPHPRELPPPGNLPHLRRLATMRSDRTREKFQPPDVAAEATSSYRRAHALPPLAPESPIHALSKPRRVHARFEPPPPREYQRLDPTAPVPLRYKLLSQLPAHRARFAAKFDRSDPLDIAKQGKATGGTGDGAKRGVR